MRDALVAGLTLNYLNERCERVKMANIAQTINVLQALIFTEGEKMMLTPTYHIYDMYKVHHDATLIPLTLNSPDYNFGDQSLPAISASASRDNEGKVHISLVNIHPKQDIQLNITLGEKAGRKVSGSLLSSEKIQSHNTFDNPKEVVPVEFKEAKINRDKLELTIPAHSVVVLEIQ